MGKGASLSKSAGYVYQILLLNVLNNVHIYRQSLSISELLSQLVTNNRIWKQRTVDIGVVSAREALDFGFSGVMVRGSGLTSKRR